MSPAFSALGPLEPLMDKCVHCGFCLSTCPSYVLLGQEMASPRGRIYLMRAGLADRVQLSGGIVHHFDTCLGCMACETACPSGVRYAPLIEATRAAIERHHHRPLGERLFRRLLFALLPYPRRLRLLSPLLRTVPALRRSSGLLKALPSRLRMLLQVAPPSADHVRPLAELTRAQGDRRQRVGLLTGCVQRVFFGSVNEATARVLAADGCEVVAPSAQGCCGALALHAGEDGDAREFARRLIEAFELAQVDVVAVNAAGCGSAMKGYGELLKDDPQWADRARRFAAKVRDVTEVLDEIGPPRATRHPLPLRVSYHDACHLRHAQGVHRQPRQLLAAIPGLSLLPVSDADICCGSAGIFNLVQPDMASQLGRRKVAALTQPEPDIIVTSNPGCLLQIAASARTEGRLARVHHVMEVLDWSIRNVSLPA